MGSGASQPSTPPVLYSFPASPPCRAVLMTLEVAKINVKIENINLLKQEQNSDKFKAINPDHTLPTLVDGKLTLWESRAIQQYLVDRYAPGHSLYPRDPVKRAPVDRILQHDISKVAPTILGFARPQLFARQAPDPDKKKEVEAVLDYLDNILQKSKYLAGDQLTIADLSVLAQVTMLDLVWWDFGRWSKLQQWLKTLKDQTWFKTVHKDFENFRIDKPAA